MVKILRDLPRGISDYIYYDGRLYELLKGFKKAVGKRNTSAVFVVDGKSGMGKTTLSNQISLYLDPKFGLHKLHYEPNTFLKGGNGKIGLNNAKAGDCIVFDEAMIISNRSAMSEINRMIITAMSMIRSKRIYVIFCVNSIFDLDRNLSIYRADILLHCYGQSLVDRGRFAAFFKGKDSWDRLKDLYLLGKKYYSYAKPRANFIGKFTKEFVVNEKDYEIQKQEGIGNFLTKIKPSLTKKEIGRNNLILHILKNKWMKVKEIAKVSGLSEVMVYEIIKNAREKSKF